MKKISYILLIISYFLLGFILIYFNLINPSYEGSLGLILSIIVITIWLVAGFIILTNKNPVIKKDKIEDCLRLIALVPVIVIVIIPMSIFTLVNLIIESFRNRMSYKCKILLEQGFELSKEKNNKKYTYKLVKNNFIIKISEFESYQISIDNGSTFDDIEKSLFITYEDRIEVENIIYKYKSCDYRDKDIYEPTTKIVYILAKYFSN
ncbi:MAG: hypothetical protein IJZ77_05520 [Bacilli bacterium]|nr:hypothetical protein [Bacilli bacterium]